MKKKYKITTHFSENRFVEEEFDESELTQRQKDLIVGQLVKDVSELPQDMFDSFAKGIAYDVEKRFNADMMALIAHFVLTTGDHEHQKLISAANKLNIRLVYTDKGSGRTISIGSNELARQIHITK